MTWLKLTWSGWLWLQLSKITISYPVLGIKLIPGWIQTAPCGQDLQCRWLWQGWWWYDWQGNQLLAAASGGDTYGRASGAVNTGFSHPPPLPMAMCNGTVCSAASAIPYWSCFQIPWSTSSSVEWMEQLCRMDLIMSFLCFDTCALSGCMNITKWEIFLKKWDTGTKLRLVVSCLLPLICMKGLRSEPLHPTFVCLSVVGLKRRVANTWNKYEGSREFLCEHFS